jgi:RNA polymerase-associated protein RTF1
MLDTILCPTCFVLLILVHRSDTADERSFDASSQSEPDVPMDLGSDSDSDDEDSGQDLYPLDGKYKDHADKENLLSMTEIDREAVLAERMAQIERAQQDRHLRNLLKSRNAADKAAAASAFTRKSMRTKSAPKKNEEATKRGKLDELRRNREERKATVGRRSPFGEEDASRKILSEGEEEERFTEEYEIVKDEREISLADVNRCRIGRTGLAKLCDYPGFDEVIQDVFVRATLWDKESAQNVYRMATAKGMSCGKRCECMFTHLLVQDLQPAKCTPCLMVLVGLTSISLSYMENQRNLFRWICCRTSHLLRYDFS